MRRAIRTLARLYPRAWRSRYGPEFDRLLEDLSPTPRTLVNICGHLASVHLRRISNLPRSTTGASLMRQTPERFALLGAAVLVPTAILIGLSVLKYYLGVSAPFDAVEPAVTPLVTHPLGETVVTLAPYVAFLLAVVPVTRIGLRWDAGRLRGTLSVAAPAVNVGIATVSVALAAFMAVYWVAENL
jgi:hypothetical protein